MVKKVKKGGNRKKMIIEVVAVVIAIGFIVAGVKVSIQCILRYRKEKALAKLLDK